MNDVGLGLIGAALLYGFRHGFDFDHLAALGDIAGSSGTRKRALALSTLYVVGHALVVLVLGIAAIALGAYVPESLDAAMGRLVGATLIGLGLYLAYSAFRYRAQVRFRSRWMLAADGVKALSRRLSRPSEMVVIEHAHDHSHVGTHEHAHDHIDPVPAGRVQTVATATTTHTHTHTHVAALPADPFKAYSARAAVGIGMVHGIGAETPSQVLLFASAAGAASAIGGMAVLLAFVAGLVAANSAVAVASAIGFADRSRMPRIYLTAAALTAAFSLALGTAYVLGEDGLIPGLFGL